MYHHHILSRDENETIKKSIFETKTGIFKRRLVPAPPERFSIHRNRNEWRRHQINVKCNLKNKIKYLVQKAAFKYFIDEKSKHSKLTNLENTSLQIQPYLASKSINNKEAELLYNLRSNCYKANYNFKKMYKNDTSCGLKIQKIKTTFSRSVNQFKLN